LTSKGRAGLLNVKRGEYRIVRVNGAVISMPEKPTLRAIQQAIGAETLDSVILKRDSDRPTIVMMVDDTGMIDSKPPNPKATELYHAICKPGTVWQIHGDVAIVHDGDFA
jgi:hypothetical protein